MAGHGVKRVGDSRNAGFERNRIAAQPVRESATVPALVMAAHDVQGDCMVPQQWLQRTPAGHRVLHDVTVLLVGEWGRLVKDLLPHADLADVVYPTTKLHLPDEFVWHTEFSRDHHGIPAHAKRVAVSVGVTQFERVDE